MTSLVWQAASMKTPDRLLRCLAGLRGRHRRTQTPTQSAIRHMAFGLPPLRYMAPGDMCFGKNQRFTRKFGA
jgi:hypothetical protein